MKKNLFRPLVLSAFLLPWTTLLLATEPAADRSFVHSFFSDHLDVERNCAGRFAWNSNPDCKLHDGERLSAVPFQTDDLPGITKDRR
jgi:hypothetical protein